MYSEFSNRNASPGRVCTGRLTDCKSCGIPQHHTSPKQFLLDCTHRLLLLRGKLGSLVLQLLDRVGIGADLASVGLDLWGVLRIRFVSSTRSSLSHCRQHAACGRAERRARGRYVHLQYSRCQRQSPRASGPCPPFASGSARS